MWRRTPSLEATEAFLAAARCASFQEAAAQLALSASAFSRRIQLFERFVGVALFDRSGTSPRLNEAGRKLQTQIEPALDTVFAAITDARRAAAQKALRVIASHSLALGWLMQRLASFHAAHGIRVDLLIGRGAHHLRSGAIDIAIWGGVDDGSGYPSEDLIKLDGVPATAPRLADGRCPPRTLAELSSYSLLRGRGAPNPWLTWLEDAHYDGAAPRFVDTDNVHFACESAANGFGVVLASPLLADRQVREERLLPCFQARHRVPIEYKMIYADASVRRREDVRIFRRWLATQINESVGAFDSWLQANSI
jgi:DNA-binding transcriptional LysR family regulator